MLPILTTILAQAANLANKNLSELKKQGKGSGLNATEAAALASQLESFNSGISQNGVV